MAEEHEDLLPGGLADRKKPEDFDAMELARGVKVELEHTTSRQLATEIAMDHLTEDPDYYRKLKKMESGTEKRGAIKVPKAFVLRAEKAPEEVAAPAYKAKSVGDKIRERAQTFMESRKAKKGS